MELKKLERPGRKSTLIDGRDAAPIPFRMFKKAAQRGRREREGEGCRWSSGDESKALLRFPMRASYAEGRHEVKKRKGGL